MTQANLTPLPPETYRSKPWKNGGGVTLDIADASLPGADPAGWEGMIWRLGRTAIVQPGPFSDLTGYERLQAVIVGSGLVLDGVEGEIDLRQPFRPVRYDGGMPLVSRLENGPVEVLNLMVDRSRCTADLRVPVKGEAVVLGVGIHILYAPDTVVSGRFGKEIFTIPGGHALRIDAEADVALTVEAGQALLASVSSR